MIAIVKTGGANLASIQHAIQRLGAESVATAEPSEIARAERVILPGVGAAGEAMERLKKLGLIDPIRALRQPVLGICLGMQILFESSEEENAVCLGLIPGTVTALQPGAPGSDITIPHMGWNEIGGTSFGGSKLLDGVQADSHVYFVHSYRAPLGEWVKASVSHGQEIPTVVQKGNFFGVQFHPEKSGRTGSQVLEAFLRV